MIGPRAAVFSFFIPGRRAVIIKIPPPPPLAREQSSCIFLTGINYWIHRDVYFTTRADKFDFERCHKVEKKVISKRHGVIQISMFAFLA
jgi:hypothetical protein